MDEFSRDWMEPTLDRAMDFIMEAVKGYREDTKGLPYGAKVPTDEEFLALWRSHEGDLVQLTDQSWVPWIVAVGMSLNGGEWLRRYRAALKRLPMVELMGVSDGRG